MNKRELYKKYVETFGVKRTLLDLIMKLGELGITTCMDYLRDDKPLNLPLNFSEDFCIALADAQIAIEVINEMMGHDNQQLLTQKHYQLRQMDTAIWNKEKENESISD